MGREKFKFNKKIFAFSSAAMLGITLFIGGVFCWLYSVSKKNIVQKWQTETMQIAQEVNFYMKMPVDAVAFSAVTLNDMMLRGKPHSIAGEYLIKETAIYSAIISENTTGVYAFYRGKYLDGSGWTPPEDYKPKTRPWYIDALKAGGKIALVKPYLNMQTFKMMMSVSQLLNDGESVVSMDIFLDGVQQRMLDLKKNPLVAESVVLSSDGYVVAHSNEEFLATDLYKYGTNEMQVIGHKILKSDSKMFETKIHGKKYAVFVENINSDWKTILVLNSAKMYRSLSLIYIISALVILAVIAVIFAMLFNINCKYEEAEELRKEVQAVADIYPTVLKINMKSDTVSILRGNKRTESLLGGDFTNFSVRAVEFGEKIAIEQSKEMVKNFMDARTLNERLENINSLSLEFMDENSRWIRTRYIVVDREVSGRVFHLLLAFESIDEDRKRQEKLRKRAETDMMTGVRNRGSGEAMVKKAMAEGRKGMFCLLDADKFKSINDTFGHSVGDKVIIAIAKCMEKTFRGSDIVFRLGGDEFAAFSEGVASKEIGEKIVARLFENIDKIDIPELQGRKISLSVGASFYPATREDSFEAMYKRADRGTYESKKQTGNALTFRAQEEDGAAD